MSLRIDSEISFRGEIIHRHSSTAGACSLRSAGGVLFALEFTKIVFRNHCYYTMIRAESLAAVVRSIETLQTEAGAFLGTRIVYDKVRSLLAKCLCCLLPIARLTRVCALEAGEWLVRRRDRVSLGQKEEVKEAVPRWRRRWR